MRTALIVGATGLIGKACLYHLLDNPAYTKVIAVVRKPLAVKNHKLEQLVVDFDKLKEYQQALIADDVYCCLGTTIKVAGSQEQFRKVDFDYPYQVAGLALKNGAEQFLLVSAMGADAASSIFYNRVKGELEKAISALGYPYFKVFRPSLLLGHRTEFRAGEQIAKVFMKGLQFLFVGPLKKYKAIEGATVAQAMVAAALLNKRGEVIYQNDQLFELAGSPHRKPVLPI